MLIFYDNTHLNYYVEQFLIDTKAQLPSHSEFHVD